MTRARALAYFKGFFLFLLRRKHRRSKRDSKRASRDSVKLVRRMENTNFHTFPLLHRKENPKREDALSSAKRGFGFLKHSLPFRVFENVNENLPLNRPALESIDKIRDLHSVALKDSKLCRSRKDRRSAIMRLTRGRGLGGVKTTTWTENSLVRCF